MRKALALPLALLLCSCAPPPGRTSSPSSPGRAPTDSNSASAPRDHPAFLAKAEAAETPAPGAARP